MNAWQWAGLGLGIVQAIAWPVVVGVAVWLLQPLLKSLRRGGTLELEAAGVRATIRAVEQQKAIEESPANESLSTAAALPEGTQSPAALPVLGRAAATQLEDRYKQELQAFPESQRQAVLLRALTWARLFGAHEYIYNRIFGSQIAGLRTLDERGSITVQEAKEYFDTIKGKYPEVYATYAFEGWLSFMLNNGLVERTGDTLRSTVFGNDFLIYLREQRLTENKLG